MARIDNSDIRGLIYVAAGVNLDPHIDTAALLVSEHLEDRGLSEERLRLIEANLAAHFTALSEERGALLTSKVGESSDTVANTFGEGLKMTRFGQTAMMLDTSGVLAKLGASAGRAEFRVI